MHIVLFVQNILFVLIPFNISFLENFHPQSSMKELSKNFWLIFHTYKMTVQPLHPIQPTPIPELEDAVSQLCMEAVNQGLVWFACFKTAQLLLSAPILESSACV